MIHNLRAIRVFTTYFLIVLFALALACLTPGAARADEGELTAANPNLQYMQSDETPLATQDANVSYTPMYRLYNPNSGEHFYTANKAERNNVVGHGWHYEGIGWLAPSKGAAVYRLYNPYAGDHHYTLNASERDHLVTVGWRYEGVGWQSCDASDKSRAAVLRQYNPYAWTGAHNFTLSQSENNHLVSVGWRAEGVAWYGHTAPSNYPDDMKPWYPNISGDYWLDTWLDLILLYHKNLRSCFDYVSSFSYRPGNEIWSGRYLDNGTSIAYAKEMITNHSGNCYRFASLMSWLARGLGYNSNVVAGWVPSHSSGKAPHGWTEVYSNGTYVCDTCMNEAVPSRNWYMVSYGNAPVSYGFW